MRFHDLARLAEVLAAVEQGEPVDPAHLAACKAALDRELRIKRAASQRSRDNLERWQMTRQYDTAMPPRRHSKAARNDHE